MLLYPQAGRPGLPPLECIDTATFTLHAGDQGSNPGHNMNSKS